MDSLYPAGAFGDLSNLVHASVMDRARACLARSHAAKAALDTPAAVQAWQARMREAFLAALGGLPDEPSDLAPVWGELRERAGYSVQNVLFHAAPRVPVTATLWRPLGWAGPRPAVVQPCGHHETPREADLYCELAALLAVNGYLCLTFDPPGQGERKLCWDPTLGRSFAGTGSAEHEFTGRQCELVGHNLARYFVRDGMRAVDLLLSLPEVDPARLAVTGVSGGGTQSAYLMLADERLACGLPVAFITDRQVYMGRTHWHDAEQNLTGSLLAGLDYDDFLIGFAPRPAAIGALSWDFFPIEGTRLAYERARQAYQVLGAEERLTLFELEHGHDYPPELRRHAVEWFHRWLQPGEAFRPLEGYVQEPDESMRNTGGQVSVALPGSRGVFEQNLAAVEATRAGRCVPEPAELAAALGLPAVPSPMTRRVFATRDEGGLTLEKSALVTELGQVPDVLTLVPVLRLAPAEPRRALVYCADEGIAGVDVLEEALLRTIAAAGTAVYLAEPRGTGETTSRPLNSAPTDTWLSQHFRMAGTSFAALRAHDLACVLAHVREREGLPIGLMARGWLGWAAVLAAALDRRVDRLCLDAARPSIEAFATTWTASPPEAYTVPGVLKLGDLADFVAASGVGRVLLTNPRGVDGEALSPEAWAPGCGAGWQAVPHTVAHGLDTVRRSAAVAGFWAG